MKVFLDIEGTGTQNNQIAQLAYIVTDDDLTVTKAKNFFFKIEQMNPFAQRLHGLSLEYLKRASDGLTFADRFEEIKNDLSDHMLICHNTRSDYDLLRLEYNRLQAEYNPSTHFCTMAHFKPICEIHDRAGRIKPPNLRELIDYHGFTEEDISKAACELFSCRHAKPHDSRFDAAALYVICDKSVSAEDFINHAAAKLPANNIEQAVVVPIRPIIEAREIKKKRQSRALQKARGKGKAPLAKHIWLFLAGLVLLSLLLSR